MSETLLSPWLWPHLTALVCCAARLLPLALLCPALGGQVPMTSFRLGLALSLAVALHFGGGVGLPSVPPGTWGLAAVAGGEAMLGTALGFVAAHPFDAARMAGRWMDTARGASAEAALPLVGTHEAATGDLLHQLMLALVMVTGAFPLMMKAVWRSFAVMPLGRWVPTESGALGLAALAGHAMGTALALGAPVVACALLIEVGLSMVSRVTPQLRLQEAIAPLKLALGAALFFVCLSFMADRLLGELSRMPDGLLGWLEGRT